MHTNTNTIKMVLKSIYEEKVDACVKEVVSWRQLYAATDSLSIHVQLVDKIWDAYTTTRADVRDSEKVLVEMKLALEEWSSSGEDSLASAYLGYIRKSSREKN